MDGHAILGHLAICADLVGDGGPRRYLRAGKPLPEKYLPGRYLAKLPPADRAIVVRAANSPITPAPWFVRRVVASSGRRSVSP
jgi:hypothetical protein